MSETLKWAENELRAGGFLDEDGDCYGDLIGKAALELMAVFVEQGHSGMSASVISAVMQKLMAREPLTPLTGENDEWIEVGEGVVQNRRCPRVFKQNGVAYDVDGRVFREPSGMTYTSRESRVSITFPYTPTTEYVDVQNGDEAFEEGENDD